MVGGACATMAMGGGMVGVAGGRGVPMVLHLLGSGSERKIKGLNQEMKGLLQIRKLSG